MGAGYGASGVPWWGLCSWGAHGAGVLDEERKQLLSGGPILAKDPVQLPRIRSLLGTRVVGIHDRGAACVLWVGKKLGVSQSICGVTALGAGPGCGT